MCTAIMTLTKTTESLFWCSVYFSCWVASLFILHFLFSTWVLIYDACTLYWLSSQRSELLSMLSCQFIPCHYTIPVGHYWEHSTYLLPHSGAFDNYILSAQLLQLACMKIRHTRDTVFGKIFTTSLPNPPISAETSNQICDPVWQKGFT